MCPREKQEKDEILQPTTGEAVVHHTPDGAPFVICRSTKAFVNPTGDLSSSDPEEVNQQLNLYLGLSGTGLTRKNKWLLWLVRFLDCLLLVHYWEPLFFYFWCELVPIQFKRRLIQVFWKNWFKIHASVVGKRTGLHPSQSFEYHALSTLMYTSNFLAWTPNRMRFALKELYASAPNDPPDPSRIQVIHHTMNDVKIPLEQANQNVVRGWYIRRSAGNHPSKGIIFWIYGGGAYLAGDVRGNASAADYVGDRTDMDVFVPQFRLAPEANLFDVLWDICLAYRWLVMEQEIKSKDSGLLPIYVVGISSGAALAVRLMQMIAHAQRDDDLRAPDYFESLVQPLSMPKGGILFGPYVDYEQLHEYERKGSFLHYAKHDLVVTQAVQEYGLPYLEDFIVTSKEETNRAARRKQSPIHISCRGLPPLCVVASEHEAVYDMTVELVNRARSEGVLVTLGVWKYMCHVFSVLHGFLPEGQISMDYVVEWMQKEQQKQEILR